MTPETRSDKRAYRKYAYIHTAVRLPRLKVVIETTPEGDTVMRTEKYFLEVRRPMRGKSGQLIRRRGIVSYKQWLRHHATRTQI